jgi:hypothetical protein
MKQYYGNYLGIVISGGDKDPDHRGRCQVFIPHIMPALYKDWNEAGNDIHIQILGTNLPNSFTLEQVDTLQAILPWAECAAPIIGAGPSARILPSGEASQTLGNAGYPTDVPTGGPVLGDLNAITPTQGVGDTGVGWTVPGVNDQNGRPVVFTRSAAAAFAQMIKDSGGIVKGSDIASTQRSEAKNKAVGGVPGSKHLRGTAMDIHGGSNNWIRANGAKYGWFANDYKGSHGGHFEFRGTVSEFGPQTASLNTPTSTGAPQSQINSQGFGLTPPASTSQDSFGPQGFSLAPPSVTPAGGASGLAGDGSAGIATTARIEDEAKNNSGAGATSSSTIAGATTNPGSGVTNNPSGSFGSTAFGNADIDEVTADDQRKANAGVRGYEGFDQRRGSGGNYYIPGVSVASRTLPVNTWVTLYDQNGNLLTNSANPTGTYRVDGTGGPQTKNNIDFYAGSNKALMDELAVIGGGTNSGNIRVAAARPEDAAKVAAAIQNQQDTQHPSVRLGPDGNPIPFGSSFGPDMNYQATGMFGYAREGQLVWCFFREGDPLFPVYFAACYGQAEWAGIQQAASPGEGEEGFDAVTFNGPGGGFRSGQTFQDLNQSGLRSDMVFEVYSKMGHNFRMGTDTVELNSLYNFRQQTEGDHHNITLQNRETRTLGDDNTVIGQDCFITVGNWDTTAQEAANELQRIVNEAMEIEDD